MNSTVMTDQFQNEVLNTSKLPQLEEVQYTPLHPQYKKVVLYQSLILALVMVGIASIPFLYSFDGMWGTFWATNKVGLLIAIVVLSFLVVLFSMLSVQCKGYAVRQHDLIYKSGLINKSTTIIPYNRVQHLELYEGAISRLFGLCQLELFTAGGSLGDLKVPGVSKAEAARIKDFVVTKVQPLQVVDRIEVDQDETQN